MNKSFERISPDDLVIDWREVWARLGGAGALSQEKIEETRRQLIEVATPAFAARELLILVNNGECISAGELIIASRDFAKIASGCRSLLVLGATLGAGVDRLIHKKSAISMAEGFIYDAVASAMAESLILVAEERTAGEREHSGRFSPGYGDMPLELQERIIHLIDGGRLLGITLNESKLMSPSKSVTTLMGVK